jgi:predicted membrane metal-binding protein
MQGILYEEPSAWLFLLVTVVLGGGAAWMTGRAISLTWRPFWQLVLWSLPLALAVRFLHYALFQGTFLSLHFYLVDLVILLALGALSFRYYRTLQMTRQYSWLYERSGPLSWREKAQA